MVIIKLLNELLGKTKEGKKYLLVTAFQKQAKHSGKNGYSSKEKNKMKGYPIQFYLIQQAFSKWLQTACKYNSWFSDGSSPEEETKI